MFEGAGKRAYKVRDQFLEAWKEHMFSNGSKNGDESVNGKSAYESDDDEEAKGSAEEDEDGSDTQSGMQDEDCLIGRDGAHLVGHIPTLVADGDRDARSPILALALRSDRREREGLCDDTNHSFAGAAGAARAPAPAAGAARAAAPPAGAAGDASAAGAQAGAPAAPATVSHFFATV